MTDYYLIRNNETNREAVVIERENGRDYDVHPQHLVDDIEEFENQEDTEVIPLEEV